MVLNRMAEREAKRLIQLKKVVDNDPILWILYNRLLLKIGPYTVVRVADDPSVEFTIGKMLDGRELPSEMTDSVRLLGAISYRKAFLLVIKYFKGAMLSEHTINDIVDIWDTVISREAAEILVFMLDNNYEKEHLLAQLDAIAYTNLDTVFEVRAPIEQMDQLINQMMEQKIKIHSLKYQLGMKPFKKQQLGDS